jgi:hypothetical protein
MTRMTMLMTRRAAYPALAIAGIVLSLRNWTWFPS